MLGSRGFPFRLYSSVKKLELINIVIIRGYRVFLILSSLKYICTVYTYTINVDKIKYRSAAIRLVFLLFLHFCSIIYLLN